jgi:hypothetical protein
MKFLVARAYSPSNNSPYLNHHKFSIVASDNSLKHVFSDANEEAKWGKRVEILIKNLKIQRPTTAEAWINLARKNMTTIEFKLSETEESISSFSQAVENERKLLLKAREDKRLKAPKYSKSNEMLMREVFKIEELVAEDSELESFLNGDEVGAMPQGYKEYIKFLIQQAGTEYLNPWLEPWLAGESGNLDFSNGIILDRNVLVNPTAERDIDNG